MTLFLLTLVVLGSVIGDLLKSYGMRLQGSPDAFNRTIMYRFAITAFHNSWFLLSLVAYAISFLHLWGFCPLKMSALLYLQQQWVMSLKQSLPVGSCMSRSA